MRGRRHVSLSLVPFDFPAAYEALNPGDADYHFYANLALTLGSERVVDLGCGTGALAARLAQAGCRVVAIDPDQAMLGVARARPGGHRVTWVLGYADKMVSGWADLITMSGHVSQLFITDFAWRTVLREAHRGLRPGGVLAFEMRNPNALSWEGWTREQTLRLVESDGGTVEFWHEVEAVDLPVITYTTHTLNLATGERTTTPESLAFRDESKLREALEAASFTIIDVFGDWDQSPVERDSPELICLARRRES